MRGFNTFLQDNQLVPLYSIRKVFSQNHVTFSKTLSARIVGGRYKLEKLVREGKIRIEKPSATQNGKWECNAADVLNCVEF